MPAADLPDRLSGAVIPAPAVEEVDEAPIWGEQRPDPDALEAAVERARRTVALQDTPELTEAKSSGDLAADLAAAREVRDLDRARMLRRRQAEIAEAEARDEHEQRMRELDRKAREAAAEASVTADALTDPHHEVVRLHRARRWVPALAAVPGVFALIAGAVNVGSQLDRLFPGVPFVSWVIDPIITLAIIAIGAAHLYDVARPRGGDADARIPNPFRRVEVLLFVLTSTAAVALHYPDGPGPDRQGADDASPLIWLSIPIGLGVSLWLVPQLRQVFTDRLREARDEARRYDEARRDERGEGDESTSGGGVATLDRPGPESTPAQQSSSGNGGRRPVRLGGRQSRDLDSLRADLDRLVQSGEVDPTSAESIRRGLRCAKDTARHLRDELRADRAERGR